MRWEYQLIPFGRHYSNFVNEDGELVDGVLSELGEDGWEIVEMLPDHQNQMCSGEVTGIFVLVRRVVPAGVFDED